MSDVGKIKNFNQGFEINKDRSQVDQAKLREVADLYEQHFIKEMIKQMKSAQLNAEGTMLKKNQAEKIFQEQLDEQYSKEWNKQGTFGLSDMIYQQLSERFSNKAQALAEPKGPLPLEQKHEVKKLNETEREMTFELKNNDLGQFQPVKNPWAGTLQLKNTSESDQTVYRIKHDNGLESLISIQGAVSEKSRHLSVGDSLQAGQEIGLSKTASPLFWTIRALDSKVSDKT